MKKMTTLCLALALTGATEAGATPDKQPKLKGRQTAAWGVAVPGRVFKIRLKSDAFFP